jgi:large subunit ribosomal protein L24
MQRIKKDDLVKVTAGGHKGKIAKVAKVTGDKVFLEKIGTRTRHMRANQFSNGQGGKKEIQLPVHISNVAVATESEKNAEKFGRIGYQTKDGQKVRVAKSTGKEIK